MNSPFSLSNGQEEPAFPFRNIESSHQPCPWSLSSSAPIPSSGEIPFLYLTDVPFVSAWTLPVFGSLFLWGILVPCWTYQIYFPLSWKLPAHTLPHWPAYTQKGHLFLLYRKHLASSPMEPCLLQGKHSTCSSNSAISRHCKIPTALLWPVCFPEGLLRYLDGFWRKKVFD